MLFRSSRIDPAREREQVAELRSRRAARDADAVGAALGAVEAGAAGSANLMPALLEAVRVGCTVGEISDALRRVWGEHRESLVL